ncbi:MAG: hypothetical protein H6728_03860 [Myxococcales bacterium]|nr:hypothetical protein [Myxococcales bacterium]
MKKVISFSLFILGALLLVPAESSATNVVCNPKHYCFAPSWGCMPCRYMRAKEVFDVKIKAVNTDIKRTTDKRNAIKRKLSVSKSTQFVSQLKGLDNKLKTLKKKASDLKRGLARLTSDMKKSARKPVSQAKGLRR